MIALLRYQAAILLRSHGWVFPLIIYAFLLLSVGASSSEPLRDGLDWSAAMLVPVVALLARSMLTAEPDAARACVAAAAGSARAHLAALLTALGAGLVLALAGAGYEVVSDKHVAFSALPPILGAGLVTAAVCMMVGSAVGTLCNPPLVRHPAVALIGTIAAVVFALVADVSPASAALRGNGATAASPAWPSGVPLLVAAGLLVVSWTASVLAASRRAG